MSDPTITIRSEGIAGWWSRHREGVRDGLTVALVVVTALLAYSTYLQLNEADRLLVTTNKLLATTNQSSTQLGQIIDKNNQLLDTLNKGIIETAYQTSLQAYEAGKPYTLYIANCHFDTKTSIISHIILISDITQNPSPVDFKVRTTYEYYTKFINGSDLQPDNPRFLQSNLEIVGPGKTPEYDVGLGSILNETKKLDHPFLYIIYWFTYNPYFAPKMADVSGPTNSTVHLLIGFEKDQATNEWKEITDNQNISCR